MLETIASHLESIAALAPHWGFALIFFFMAVESSFIPFPSEVSRSIRRGRTPRWRFSSGRSAPSPARA